MFLIREFFVELDSTWRWPAAERSRLDLIGSAALMLAEPRYQRGTKDGDVFETIALKRELQEQLLEAAGPKSELSRRRSLYLDIVRNGVPFLPHAPMWHPLREINMQLTHFELYSLDVVDVVVSKLKRFHANDRVDIQAMIDLSYVPHQNLLTRFRSAVDEWAHDARADLLPSIVANLHRVERDMMGVPETEIELPSWI